MDSNTGTGVQRPHGVGGSVSGMAPSTEEDPGLYGHTGRTDPLGNDGDGAPQNPRESGRRKKRRTKGRIIIASLNMRGGNGATGDKWLRINQLLRDEKIAVIALQETHLTDERRENLNELFKASMRIYGSADPVNATGARGVAFAVNLRIVAEEDMTMKTVIPGRACTLNFRWTGERVMRILNVYAPNNHAENEAFWTMAGEKVRDMSGRNPEIVLGDFNLVADSRDRLPPRGDPEQATESLGRFMRTLGLTDGWRENNPTMRAFTYLQTATGSQSRIDRIYVTPELMRKAEDWNHSGPGFPTDHRVVSVSLANYKAPGMGKGRWALPQVLLGDGEFAKTMREMGMKLQNDMMSVTSRTEESNHQKLYQAFKVKLRDAARKRAKALIPKIDRKIQALKTDIEDALGAEHPDEQSVAVLQDKLMRLEVKRFERKRRAVATKDWLKGETMSRYWTKLNAPQLPSTVIMEMRTRTEGDGRRIYTSVSTEMAKTAMHHYDGLQADPEIHECDHERAIGVALEPLDAKLSTQKKGELAKRIKRLEVAEAVRESPLGKAPGLDGLPAEVWKTLLRWEEADGEAEREAFRISWVLKSVFNDIEKHGIDPETTFTDGWICPIYKLKKDQREVVNYRPITLLNADYKVMTRVLAMRLANVADDLVKPDQAAFIPGRQIFSNIKLSRMIIDYAEAEEVNGAIVALDQEKAYDMVNHDYIWAVLRKMNFPENFVRTAQQLYARAKSCVMVNGTQSDFYSIVRGVRQGDPMSCLLFILAIEPLACALRKSNLRGMTINGEAERLITTLFADDTTVFLDEHDDFMEMQGVLDKWCAGARARFNVEKTEVLPVGTEAHRQGMSMRTGRSKLCLSIPVTVRVIKDGELIRSLGAWIGNKCDGDEPWRKMLLTLEKNLQHWTRRKPTMYGRKLIVGMEVGGRTQFLAKAQPMSEKIEKRLETMVAEFITNGEKRPRVGRDTMYKPVAEGGLNLLDVKARNEAIDVVWLREYLCGTNGRQRWAGVADAIFAHTTVAAARNVDDLAKVNAFTQTWKISTHHTAGLSCDLKRLAKVAEKYNLRIEAPNPAETFKEAMPVWYHIGEDEGRSLANTVSARCLRENHAVMTVGECASVAARIGLTGGRHKARRTCTCYECDRDRTVKGCTDPSRCAAMAARMVEKLYPIWRLEPTREQDNLSLTPTRIRRNAEAWRADERVTFNPSVTDGAQIAKAYRIFGITEQARRRPARRGVGRGSLTQEIEVFTDGSCNDNGSSSAVAAFGVWYGKDDRRNVSARVPGEMQSNQVAEIMAIEEAVRIAPPRVALHIVSDSRFAVDGLTIHTPAWEDRDWIGVKCAERFKRAVARLRARDAVTTLRWVKGHAGNEGNEGADELAKAGLEMPQGPETNLGEQMTAFLHTGVRLCTVTQRLAYAAVRREKETDQRPTSARMIETARAALSDDYGVNIPEAKVWKGIRDKDIPRKMKDFLWKLAHGAQRVGRYWQNIAGYEQRATCETCGTEDSMDHILLECEAPGQETIWKMVKSAIRLTGVDIPRVSVGTIIGAPSITLKRADGKIAKGPTRLARILIVEAAHMIWRLRCERVIGVESNDRGQMTVGEVRGRFWAAVNSRMQVDRSVTLSRVQGRKTRTKVVLETWRKILARWEDLPNDWIAEPGVLVGTMGQPRQLGVG